MSLAPGTRLGPYEIVSMVGAGGMGEVYRARDPKLQRDVALKILPDVFASDSDRLARFQREARTLAALNHPHIAGIYGFEENAGTYAIALEFVEGETLIYSSPEGLMSVSAHGGSPRLVVPASKEEVFDRPRFLPDGRTVLYSAISRLPTAAALSDARVMAGSLDGKSPKVVIQGAFDARYVLSGHLIYGVGGSLMAVRFDPITASATGDARPVLQEVRHGTGPFSGTYYVAVSETGTLAYVPPYSPNRQLRRLVWVDRHGGEEPIPSEARPYTNPRIAPNGNKIAFSTGAACLPRRGVLERGSPLGDAAVGSPPVRSRRD